MCLDTKTVRCSKSILKQTKKVSHYYWDEIKPHGLMFLYKKFLRIAKRDIVVYKVLISRDDGTYRSNYQNYEYERGMHYYRTGSRVSTKFGLTFLTFCTSKSLTKPNTVLVALQVDNGLHAWRTLAKAQSTISPYHTGTKIFKMVIPKGSLYILGTNRDIVSDNLIWFK